MSSDSGLGCHSDGGICCYSDDGDFSCSCVMVFVVLCWWC